MRDLGKQVQEGVQMSQKTVKVQDEGRVLRPRRFPAEQK